MSERFLVSVADLADEGASSAPPVVLDASVLRVREPRPHYADGGRLFAEAHLPGARHADLMGVFSDPDSGLPFTAPGPAALAAAVAGVGAELSSDLVVYDIYDGTWAARLWWLLRAYGYQVRILDGGLRAWRAAGLPIETGAVRPTPATADDAELLTASLAAHAAPSLVGIAEVERAITTGDALLVCGLRPPVYRGDEKAAARAGHIPTSINIPYASLIDSETKRHLDAAELVDQVGGADQRVITYCGGGVNAAGVAFALLRAGVHAVSVYDGSMSEWAADPSRPLALGAAPGGASARSERAAFDSANPNTADPTER